MQPCGAVPVSWKRRSLELIDDWGLEMSPMSDTFPDALAGFVLSVDKSTWWNEPQSEIAVF